MRIEWVDLTMVFVQLTLIGLGAKIIGYVLDFTLGPVNEQFKGVKMFSRLQLGIATVVLFAIFLLGLTGCGGEGRSTIVVQSQACTVSKQDGAALISCPDGTSVVLPPDVVDHFIEVREPFPVFIEIPKYTCDQCKKECKKHRKD